MPCVYLICLDSPFHHVRHYIGYTHADDPMTRIQQHRTGVGSRVSLLRAVRAAGVTFTLTRVWYGAGHDFERKLKRGTFVGKNAPSRSAVCPRCSGESAFGIAVWPRQRDNRSRARAGGAGGRSSGVDVADVPLHLHGWDDRPPDTPDDRADRDETDQGVLGDVQ